MAQLPPILTVIAAGQSLAAGGGWRALPEGARAASVAPPDPARLFMLNTGTITGSLEPVDPAAITALVPIREDADRGESQGTAMLRMLGARHPGTEWLYLNHAVAGQPMAALVGEATPQRNGLAQLAAAVRLAAAQGRRVCVVAATWSHGETDRKEAARAARRGRRGAHPRIPYRMALLRHAASSTSDYARITGQSEPIWTLVDQLSAATNREGPSEIALAQADAAATPGARIALIGPRYQFRPPFGWLDAVHLQPLGYAVLGEYHAKAIGRLLAAGAAADPPDLCLRADLPAIRREERVLVVPLKGACGPIVLDVESVPPAPGLGFAWTPAAGEACIVSVVTDGDSLILTLSEPGPGRLSYAMTESPDRPPLTPLAWGNVRDSDPTPSLAAPGLALHNWLTIFEADIA